MESPLLEVFESRLNEHLDESGLDMADPVLCRA